MLLCFFCLVFKKNLHWSIHWSRRATADKVKCHKLSDFSQTYHQFFSWAQFWCTRKAISTTSKTITVRKLPERLGGAARGHLGNFCSKKKNYMHQTQRIIQTLWYEIISCYRPLEIDCWVKIRLLKTVDTPEVLQQGNDIKMEGEHFCKIWFF